MGGFVAGDYAVITNGFRMASLSWTLGSSLRVTTVGSAT